MYKVRFVVHDDSKSGSYPIKIVGNLPELGNWNPENGLEMEEYYDHEWESTKLIQVPFGQQFEFKLIKILGGKSAPEWEELPNNSNRKFKPKFNTKLVLKWSSHLGQAFNEAKSSMKLKGLPGVMVNDRKQGGLLKKDPKKKKKSILSDSDSDSQNDNDSFCVGRKRSSDIREIMNSSDIQQIYYDTTELQNAYLSFKQIQVFIVSSRPHLNKSFQQRIDQQLKQLHQLENFKFKWLFLGENDPNMAKFKKISFKKIQKSHNQKIHIQQHAIKNVHRNYFIFVDLDAALRTVVGNSSACLYLPTQQFQKAINFLKDLQKFQLICFDSGEANRKLLKIFQEKRIQNQLQEQKTKKRQDKISELSKLEKSFGQITLYKILEQLELWQAEITINTLHTFTKNEALVNILQPNSILLIDSQIMKTDQKFFYSLLDSNCEKRLVIIIHKTGVPQWIHKFSEQKNICIILDNFMKLYFLGKLYDPSLKHRNAIQFIKMRARLFEKQFGGSWQINEDSFTFKFEDGTLSKAKNIKAQIQNVLMKDYNYFKFHIKQNKLKITWNLSHPVRLLRTLVRIKSIEEGMIGNFYIVSQNDSYSELKEQLRLLINTNQYIMIQRKATQVYDFGFGNTHSSKYSIKIEKNQKSDSRSSTSSTQIQNEMLNLSNKKRKLQFLQKKYSKSQNQQQLDCNNQIKPSVETAFVKDEIPEGN